MQLKTKASVLTTRISISKKWWFFLFQ